MRRKRWQCLVLAGAMALSMAGCGKADGKDEKKATASDASETEAVAATPVEDDGDWSTTEVVIEEDNRFTTVEGDDAMGLTFDDDDITGFSTYINGGDFTIAGENDALVADIKKTGSLEHSNQMYYDGFTMAHGCVYTISFDISCTVERSIEWRVQLNGGDYHAYASDHIKIGPDVQTITKEFTMEDNSDPAPRFVFNMGAVDDSKDLPEHKVIVDNISLFVTDSSNAEQITATPIPNKVKVNQIGYAPDDKKTVITTDAEDAKFKIVDASTDETVYVGEYEPVFYDKAVSSNVRRADFTDFKTPGEYYIVSKPSGASYHFSIGDGLYEDMYKDVVLMLYKQRCGVEVSSDIAGEFGHAACHTDKAIVYGDESKKVDVTGGWHDAGDYGRYVVSGAKTVADLFLTYADFDYTNDALGIPESGNKIPDVLDEAKFELDWMLKMQDASGGVYHKVTGYNFPDTCTAVEEKDQMVLAPISYAATADFAAVMAYASVLYKDFDAAAAEAYGAAAAKAYAYMEKAPKEGFKNPEEIVTGEYPDKKLSDEDLWAAAELYLATGDAKYADAVKAGLSEDVIMGLGWGDVGTYALYDLARRSEDAEIQKQAEELLLAETDKLLGKCKEDGFYQGFGMSYPWGSNMTVANNGMLFLFAYNLTGNEEYHEYAQRQRDYICGVNGTAYCYVTGYGEHTPNDVHHRPSQVAGKAVPGMLVGGPNNGLDDPYANAVLYGMPPALCYVDSQQSYACNEVTVYWNSPLIYLLTDDVK